MRLVNMKTSQCVIAITITLVHTINGFALETGDNHCYRCSPGFVDENKCRESGKTTSCTLCSHEKYSSNLDYSTECTDCTTVFGCDVTQTLLRNCTPEHDSLCGCQNHETMSLKGICRINDKDFYVTNSGIWCRKCPPGSHVVEHCMISGTNSSCETCEVRPYPKFNLFWTHSKECEYCTICEINYKQQTLTKCTPTSDTVCTCLPGYSEQINGPVLYCSGQDIESNQSKIQQPNIIHKDVNITNTTPMIPDRDIPNRKPESNTSTNIIAIGIVSTCIILAAVIVGLPRLVLCIKRICDVFNVLREQYKKVAQNPPNHDSVQTQCVTTV